MVSESPRTGPGTWQCQWTGLLHQAFYLSSWRRYFERWPRPPHLPHTLQWACVLHIEALITTLTLPGTPQPLQGGQGLPLCRSALQMWQHKESRVPRCRMPRCPESSPRLDLCSLLPPRPGTCSWPVHGSGLSPFFRVPPAVQLLLTGSFQPATGTWDSFCFSTATNLPSLPMRRIHHLDGPCWCTQTLTLRNKTQEKVIFPLEIGFNHVFLTIGIVSCPSIVSLKNWCAELCRKPSGCICVVCVWAPHWRHWCDLPFFHQVKTPNREVTIKYLLIWVPA